MADSQRKTANLFEYSAITTGYRIQWTTGNDYPDDTAVRSDYIPVSSGTYSCSDSVIVLGYDANKNYIGATNGDGIFEKMAKIPTTQFTILANSDCNYIKILSFYNVQTLMNIDAETMLNTGLTPLPYEPYGWQHSLRKLTTATDTITTLPADLYADGTNATVGLKGNMVQTGTPTSQNPIQPSETGERTANLFDKNDVLQGYRIGGDGLPFNDDECALSDYIEVTPNTIVNQHQAFGFGNCMAEYDKNKTFIIRYTSGNGKITTSASTKYIRVAVSKIRLDKVMVTMGATAPTSYEPYGYKLDIKSANTTTPVYLGEVQSTRRIKKLVLTGEENWTLQSINSYGIANLWTRLPADFSNQQLGLSSHLSVQTTVIANTETEGFYLSSQNVLYIRINVTRASTVADFKAYLAQQYAAGTPVTVWYVLATETTGIVNEPLRKIGDCADTVSGITIPTITGADTFDVLTTLKPSEVSLTYTGWHDASVKEWDGSEWQ